jgi:FkbM family methyltransferase
MARQLDKGFPRMDLSYAQHLEDYHLDLIFGERAAGFYIDVGAGHPVADNVSCLFYLKGWRGIVVEPQADLLALYEHVRPRDSREGCALGCEAGEVEFHVVDRLHGFSTTMPAFAAQAANFGVGYSTRRVPMKTLASLCEEHNVPTIDFLKIDVEGAEGEVLAGNDWTRWRPRVVLCEAVAPGSMAENWNGWEPFLLGQNYEFMMFDGLNRWYLAREASDLRERFPRAMSDWLVVRHLGHTNRAPFRDDHPDHTFAKDFVGAFLAKAPTLPRDLLLQLVLHGETCDLDAPLTSSDRTRIVARMFPQGRDAIAGIDKIDARTSREFYAALIDADAFRVMLGRMAASYDGGQILD